MSKFILNEEEMLVAFSKGDAMAFEAIYNKFHTHVFFIAQNYLGEDNAEDIRANCFMKLWEMHDKLHFDSMGALYSWLRRTTSNNCIDYLRKISFRRNKEIDVINNYILSNQEGVYELSDKEAIIIERLRKQVEGLPLKFKEVFQMRLKDMKFKEIAAILHADISTIKKRYARALTLINRGLNFFIFLI